MAVCKYCKSEATKGVIWADGRGRIPVCDKHEAKARAKVRSNDDQVDKVTRMTAEDLVEARLHFGDHINTIFEADVTKSSVKKELQQAMSKVLKRIKDPAKRDKMKANMQKSMDIVVGWVPA